MSHETSDSEMNEFVHTVADALMKLTGWKPESIDLGRLNEKLEEFLQSGYDVIVMADDEDEFMGAVLD